MTKEDWHSRIRVTSTGLTRRGIMFGKQESGKGKMGKIKTHGYWEMHKDEEDI